MTQLRAFVWLFAVAAVLGALITAPTPVDATPGVDDYPRRLKQATQDSLVDPWLFYNRECTSFVAWRLNNDNGVPFSNYYLDVHWGDASNWRSAAVAAGVLVDDKPNHGAVAWWSAGSVGSSVGHVAWVQRVSKGSITIEEYNYAVRGTYGTRTIDRSSSTWPDAFIHLGKVDRLRNVDPPTVSGSAQVGKRLTATRGSWSSRGLDFSYQWLADGKPIERGTRKFLQLRAAERGAKVQVRVTASKDGTRSVSSVSAKTAKTAPGEFDLEDPPAINGVAQVGRTLTAAKGTWSPRGSFSYQWYAGAKAVSGATDRAFTPTAAQLDKQIRVKVVATRDGYRRAAQNSDSTDEVAPGRFTNSAPPTIEGTPQVGVPLTALPGTWSPEARYSYQWFADGDPVKHATKATFTPRAGQLRAELVVKVTAAKAGYVEMTRASAASAPVAPGGFLSVRAPRVKGKPQVGVPLTAYPGEWAPKPRIRLQWYAGNKAIAGEHGEQFTPTPAQLGKVISVEVTAKRRGYLTVVVRTPATVEVAPGVIENLEPPTVRGASFVGRSLRATAGEWSPAAGEVGYQWLRDGDPIDGATDSVYVLRRADGGHEVSVRVRVTADGYRPARAHSSASAVLFGTVAVGEKPTIGGQAVVGRTLTARAKAVTPRRAELSYQWYRGDHLIHGATDATYMVTRRDTGARLTVVVTASADDWAPTSRRSVRTAVVRDPG